MWKILRDVRRPQKCKNRLNKRLPSISRTSLSHHHPFLKQRILLWTILTRNPVPLPPKTLLLLLLLLTALWVVLVEPIFQTISTKRIHPSRLPSPITTKILLPWTLTKKILLHLMKKRKAPLLPLTRKRTIHI